MSSQFSYELDERHIRLMMQDAELDYNEAMWHKFDEMAITQTRAGSNIGSYMPNINLSISRSIIVPVIFIVLIGGLSAMLFSFVDFKKKESIQKEVPYVAKMETVKKPEVTSTAIVKPKSIKTPTLTAATPPLDTTSANTVTSNSVAAVITPPVVKKEETAKMVESKPKPDPLKNVILSQQTTSKEVTVPIKKKIKRKDKTTEVLPIINASTPNLNEGASEPELDLK